MRAPLPASCRALSLRPPRQRLRAAAAALALPAAALAIAACGGSISASNPGGGGSGVVQTIQQAPVIAERQDHTATRLDTGDVLIAGGGTAGGALVAQAERYEPLGQQFRATLGAMVVARARHTATRLNDPRDRVLLAGGQSTANGAEATTELYDPGTDRFTAGPNLTTARRRHTATLTNRDEVIIAGGEDANGNPLASIERFNTDASQVVAVGTLVAARTRHTAVFAPDNRLEKVIILGGRTGPAPADATASVEYVDPVNGQSRLATGGLRVARSGHAAVTLADGRILVVGGVDASGAALGHAEVYDPFREQSFGAGQNLLVPRSDPVATRLFADARVIVTGNGNQVDIYDPFGGRFTAGAALANARVRHTVTVLGIEALVFGGGGAQTPAELFLND